MYKVLFLLNILATSMACEVSLPSAFSHYSVEESRSDIPGHICLKMKSDLSKSLTIFRKSKKRQQQNQFLYKENGETYSLQIQQLRTSLGLRGQLLVDKIH